MRKMQPRLVGTFQNTVQAQPDSFGLQHLDSPKGKMPDKVIAWVVLTVLTVLS